MKSTMHVSEERILEIIDRSAAPASMAEEKHLNRCPACGGIYREYLQLYPQLSDLSIPELPPDFSQRVLERLPETVSPERKSGSWGLWLGLGMMTVGLLVTLQIVYGLFSGFGSSMLAFIGSSREKLGLGKVVKELMSDDTFRLLLMVPFCFSVVGLLDWLIRRRHHPVARS